MRPLASLLLLAAACTPVGGAMSPADGGAPTEHVCQDEAGAPSSCPFAVTGSLCARGNATACTPVLLEEVTTGPTDCLRLVVRNDCGVPVYSNTCVEYKSSTDAGWQCWTSSTLPGETIDVSECDATGRYSHVSSDSQGELNVIEQQGSCANPG